MAKCTICNSRKGKRKCKVTESFICSLCCGQSRVQEKCEGCSFFKGNGANRKYRSLPYHSTQEMSGSEELDRISSIIETALCEVWVSEPQKVTDLTVLALVEIMLEKYHFANREMENKDPVLAAGTLLLIDIFDQELIDVSAIKLVKVLGAVYRSIQRRTVGGSSYLEFISHFTGVYPGKTNRPIPAALRDRINERAQKDMK